MTTPTPQHHQGHQWPQPQPPQPHPYPQQPQYQQPQQYPGGAYPHPYQQAPVQPASTTTQVSKSGISGMGLTVHIVLSVLTFWMCGGWLWVWFFHWLFTRNKTVTHTHHRPM